jgi:hypothetical protein
VDCLDVSRSSNADSENLQWFDKCLEGKREEVLEGPSKEWPEVEFWDL